MVVLWLSAYIIFKNDNHKLDRWGLSVGGRAEVAHIFFNEYYKLDVKLKIWNIYSWIFRVDRVEFTDKTPILEPKLR